MKQTIVYLENIEAIGISSRKLFEKPLIAFGINMRKLPEKMLSCRPFNRSIQLERFELPL
jgi:hypothetical protein